MDWSLGSLLVKLVTPRVHTTPMDIVRVMLAAKALSRVR